MCSCPMRRFFGRGCANVNSSRNVSLLDHAERALSGKWSASRPALLELDFNFNNIGVRSFILTGAPNPNHTPSELASLCAGAAPRGSLIRPPLGRRLSRPYGR